MKQIGIYQAPSRALSLWEDMEQKGKAEAIGNFSHVIILPKISSPCIGLDL